MRPAKTCGWDADKMQVPQCRVCPRRSFISDTIPTKMKLLHTTGRCEYGHINVLYTAYNARTAVNVVDNGAADCLVATRLAVGRSIVA